MLERLPHLDLADVAVTTVIEPSISESLEAAVFLADTAGIRRQIARQMIDRIAGEWMDHGVTTQALILEGEVSTELLKLAKSLPDHETLFVCGSGANSISKRLGSVSRKLLLYSGASILIGRPYRQNAANGSVHRIRHKDALDILVAVDDAEGSRIVVECFEQVLSPIFRNLYAVSIEPFPLIPPDSDLAIFLPTEGCDLLRVTQLASKSAKRMSRCAQQSLGISGIGSPAEEIAQIAAEKDVDLIVVGASRHSLFGSLIVGSCSHELSGAAPCPVLILRSKQLFTQA